MLHVTIAAMVAFCNQFELDLQILSTSMLGSSVTVENATGHLLPLRPCAGLQGLSRPVDLHDSLPKLLPGKVPRPSSESTSRACDGGQAEKRAERGADGQVDDLELGLRRLLEGAPIGYIKLLRRASEAVPLQPRAPRAWK